MDSSPTAMRATLVDPQQQRTLEEFGFVVVPFMDEAGIDALREVHDGVGVAPDDPGLALYFGHQSKSVDQKRAVSAALDPIVRARAGEVFDDHEMYLTMFITKWPGPNSGFGPHQDPTLVDERSFRGVTIWIPLCDTGVVDGRDNGMLHVVPGSHRFVQGPRVRDVNESVYSVHEAAILESHGLGVPTRLGEAIVFDNRTIHYSLPNETQEPRVVVSLGMRPREARCVVLRHDGAGMVDLFEVNDSWNYDVNPTGVHLWSPAEPPAAKLEPLLIEFSGAEFDRLCEAVGEAPHTVPAHRPLVNPDGVDVDPGVFCAFCGTTSGLEERDRTGKGKAQFLCRSCEAEVRSTYGAVCEPDLAATSVPSTIGSGRAPEPERDPASAGTRVLFVGGAPDGSEDDLELRDFFAALRSVARMDITTVWLLDGPSSADWQERVGPSWVVDHLRTWRPAELVEKLAGPWFAAKARGQRLRMLVREMGEFDVAVLHGAVGDRVVGLLRERPALLIGLWTHGGGPISTENDHPREVDLHVAEPGTEPTTAARRTETMDLTASSIPDFASLLVRTP